MSVLYIWSITGQDALRFSDKLSHFVNIFLWYYYDLVNCNF